MTSHISQEIQAWLIDLTTIPANVWPPLTTYLSPDEQAELAAKKHPETYLAARAFTRLALSQALQIAPLDLEITRTEKGKPQLHNYQNIGFNLSHSGNYLALAITQGEPHRCYIGVDIERHKKRDIMSIAKNYFHAHEYALLENYSAHADQQQTSFFKLWTLKEAFFKALGTGIVTGLHKADFSNFIINGQVTFSPDLQQDPADWVFQSQTIESGSDIFQCAIATNSTNRNSIQFTDGLKLIEIQGLLQR